MAGVLLATLVLAGCGTPLEQAVGGGIGVQAPAQCGFPDGTALEFGGRSTTSALGVQEVVGDPMSDDPADIYITRDAFDQGELHGRLVCAIYVNDPGFVETTVHPADGGRFIPEPEPTPEPLASDEVEITTHCGLDFARVEWEGRVWKFDVEDQANPPWWWGNPTEVVQIRPGPDGPIVIGPFFTRWQLIPAGDDDELGMCM